LLDSRLGMNEVQTVFKKKYRRKTRLSSTRKQRAGKGGKKTGGGERLAQSDGASKIDSYLFTLVGGLKEKGRKATGWEIKIGEGWVVGRDAIGVWHCQVNKNLY